VVYENIVEKITVNCPWFTKKVTVGCRGGFQADIGRVLVDCRLANGSLTVWCRPITLSIISCFFNCLLFFKLV
jgi:hypothetical protein